MIQFFFIYSEKETLIVYSKGHFTFPFLEGMIEMNLPKKLIFF